MLAIVTSPGQAMDNIRTFQHEVARSPELQARLAYARAWYAIEDAGQWIFGPSKFIGYHGVTAEAYLETAEETDGRRTEAQLQTGFGVVDSRSTLYAELSSALATFLAKYGKAPSAKMRINILRARRQLTSSTFTASNVDAQAAVVDLIVAVSKTLPDDLFQRLRSQLDDVWAA